jgi:hypothetical protein
MVLYDQYPLIINPTLAKLIGLNEAIVLQQIHYWIEKNRMDDRNFREGYHWTYNSINSWHKENFDFWSFDTLKRTFKSLESKELLVVSNFNKDPRDRTKWYRINHEQLEKYTIVDVPRRKLNPLKPL